MGAGHVSEPTFGSSASSRNRIGDDLLVIGAGLSGLMAAVTAAAAGLRVRLIAKGMGATHWEAGTIDLFGYEPGGSRPVVDPLVTCATLPANHPYTITGPTGIRAALRDFEALVANQALPYIKGAAGNLLLPTAMGSVRPAWLAPAAQAGGRVDDPQPMLILGWPEWRDFYPAWIAANLRGQGVAARAALLPAALLAERREWTTVQLAQRLEKEGARRQLGTAIKALLQPGERVGLPAVLGWDQHETVWQRLQDEVGAPVFEIPTLPPSVAGIRLHRALLRAFTQVGGVYELGQDVVVTQVDAGTIVAVGSIKSGRTRWYPATSFLLASGGLLGGGFYTNPGGEVKELIFNLPLLPSLARKDWFRPRWLHQTGQPIFKVGVRINEQFQPVDAAGTVCFTNLYAAGSTLAFADGIRERSRTGIDVVTGYMAARQVS